MSESWTACDCCGRRDDVLVTDVGYLCRWCRDGACEDCAA